MLHRVIADIVRTLQKVYAWPSAPRTPHAVPSKGGAHNRGSLWCL